MAGAIRKHAADFIAIIAMIAIAVGVGGYILSQQASRPNFPLIEDPPILIEAQLSDAQAVVPGQGQSVRVAGVQVGKIGGVEVEDGLAIVEMNIDAEYEDLIREDASALLRPRTGLKDMFMEVDPGSKATPAMGDGGRITVENTAPDIDPDEILSALDSDTRAYLKLLVGGAGQGLEDNGEALREVFFRLEPLHRDLEAVQGAFADRRDALRQLVHNYGVLTEELGRNDERLTSLVSASNDVFEAFASEDENISLAVSRLPGTLAQTENTLVKVNDLGQVLGPTLDDLRPAVRQLDVANREIIPLVREGTPILRDEIRPFVRDARPYIDELRPAADQLADATPDLTTSFGELNRFFNMIAFNPAGETQANANDPRTGNDEPVESSARDEGYLYWLAWVTSNGVSLHSTSDAQGVLRRGAFSVNCATVQNLLFSILTENFAAIREGIASTPGLPPPLADAVRGTEDGEELEELLGPGPVSEAVVGALVAAQNPLGSGVDALIDACEGDPALDTIFGTSSAASAQGDDSGRVRGVRGADLRQNFQTDAEIRIPAGAQALLDRAGADVVGGEAPAESEPAPEEEGD